MDDRVVLGNASLLAPKAGSGESEEDRVDRRAKRDKVVPHVVQDRTKTSQNRFAPVHRVFRDQLQYTLHFKIACQMYPLEREVGPRRTKDVPRIQFLFRTEDTVVTVRVLFALKGY